MASDIWDNFYDFRVFAPQGIWGLLTDQIKKYKGAPNGTD